MPPVLAGWAACCCTNMLTVTGEDAHRVVVGKTEVGEVFTRNGGASIRARWIGSTVAGSSRTGKQR